MNFIGFHLVLSFWFALIFSWIFVLIFDFFLNVVIFSYIFKLIELIHQNLIFNWLDLGSSSANQINLVKSNFNWYLFCLILFLSMIIFCKSTFKIRKLVDLLHNKYRSAMKRMQNMCTIKSAPLTSKTGSVWRTMP